MQLTSTSFSSFCSDTLDFAKKLRSPERRALSNLRARKQNRTSQVRSKFSQEPSYASIKDGGIPTSQIFKGNEEQFEN